MSEMLRYRFVRGMGWDSRVIEWWTRCDFSHVEMLMGEVTLGAQLNGGVEYRSVNDSCYRNAKIEVWQVPFTDMQERAGFAFDCETNGKPYDWKGILAFGFGDRDWTEPDSWWCSEWAVMRLIRMGLVKLPAELPVTRITPRDAFMLFSALPGAEKMP